ncbi:hypothetical protein PanWU01x14_019550 [Parasponia andersonii]|uniref:Uncharacterized protein n=1 Tax=Parasponia andersonii TaxID=3476 RepID=A0A2P5DYG2_PARAD|nr:hypothetical protein PanWU01x14_019550 [Parasponia andersonii]
MKHPSKREFYTKIDRESRENRPPLGIHCPWFFSHPEEIGSRRLSSCSSADPFVGNQEGDHPPDQLNGFRE